MKEALILELKNLIITELNLRRVTPEQIGDDQILFGPEGLGLDSLDAVQIGGIIGERYQVEIPTDPKDGAKILGTVGSMAAFILNSKKSP